MQGAAVRPCNWWHRLAADSPPGVIQALQVRRALPPGPPFADNLRIALVAEGGAMRGVVAGGMVSAIERLGFTDCFDLMVGSSAGACALAYLRAGQARFGTRIFYEDINNPRFISRARLLRGRRIADNDFLIDEVFRRIKPLDTDALARQGPELLATATDVDGARTELLSNFDDAASAMEILRATSRMPLVSGGTVAFGGRRFLDGSMLMHIPIDAAIDLGATHILVILTKPYAGSRPEGSDFVDRHILPKLLSLRYGRRLGAAARAAEDRYVEIRHMLNSARPVTYRGASVVAVAPSAEQPEVPREERNAGRLKAAAADGDRQMAAILERST